MISTISNKTTQGIVRRETRLYLVAVWELHLYGIPHLWYNVKPITSFSCDHPDSLTPSSRLTISISYHLLHCLWASQSKYTTECCKNSSNYPHPTQPNTSSVWPTKQLTMCFLLCTTVHNYNNNNHEPKIKLNSNQPSTLTTTCQTDDVNPSSTKFRCDSFTSLGTVFGHLWSRLVQFPFSSYSLTTVSALVFLLLITTVVDLSLWYLTMY